MSAFWKALSVFIGTIVGVGIFGLPWVAYKSGFFILLFYFLILATVAIVVHLMLGDIILKTKGKHRFPGYVREYLGERWSKVSFFAICFGLFGAQLAYLLVGGVFLTNLLSPYLGGSFLIYVLIFFVLGSILIYKGIKSISLTEFLVLLFFFGLLIFFVFKAFPYIKIERLLESNLKLLFYPYGVVLFALWGAAILPEVKEILKGNRKKLRKTIISGIIISLFIYLIFTAIILGACGSATSEDAVTGLGTRLGGGVARAGFIFGFITCFTSFLTLGLTLKKVFWYDMHLSERASWAIAVFIPLILFLAGFRQFISIIGLTGAVAGGIEGFIIIFLYKAFLKEKFSKKMNPVYFLLSIFFTLGIVAEILYFVLK
ncbi:MAG: aromatic amino acid transport family protein [Patescibacteria group bacterium]|nr:aromatic amino acid transport family protein [Patescibacteria group bacterium]